MEPFGYFKAEPFGWVDCSCLDEDAKPLYDQAAIDSLSADVATLEQSDKMVRARLDRVQKERDALLQSAIDVVARWDSPKWKDLPHTGTYIEALRDAVNLAKESEA